MGAAARHKNPRIRPKVLGRKAILGHVVTLSTLSTAALG